MSVKISVPSLPWWAKLLDLLMIPVMHIVTGTLFVFGSPQRTHRWNNKKLSSAELVNLNEALMVHGIGNSAATKRWWSIVPIFHIPILGGWRNYVVLEPQETGLEWCVGWSADDVAGVSQIPVSGPVRLLVGPGPCFWFGIHRYTHEQIKIKEVGRGRLWNKSTFNNLPLL